MPKDGKLWDDVKARHDAYDKQKAKEIKKQSGVDLTKRYNPNPSKPSGTGGVRG